MAALAGLLEPARGALSFAVWLDLGWAPRQQPLCDRLLARLNERGLQLLQPARAVIVSGPLSAEAKAGEVAPDLWAVRAASLQVPMWESVRDGALMVLAPSAVTGGALTYLPLWAAAWRTYLSAPLTGADQPAIDLELGWSAAEELLRHGRPGQAAAVLEQTRRGSAAQAVPGVAPADRAGWRQALLEGDSSSARRHWESARHHYAQALAISERRVQLTDDSPEALCDLAIGWQKLGLVDEAAGDRLRALQSFRQSLSAAEAALRQSPLDTTVREVVDFARSRLSALNALPA